MSWFKNNFIIRRFKTGYGNILYIKVFKLVTVFQWVNGSYDIGLMMGE